MSVDESRLLVIEDRPKEHPQSIPRPLRSATKHLQTSPPHTSVVDLERPSSASRAVLLLEAEGGKEAQGRDSLIHWTPPPPRPLLRNRKTRDNQNDTSSRQRSVSWTIGLTSSKRSSRLHIPPSSPATATRREDVDKGTIATTPAQSKSVARTTHRRGKKGSEVRTNVSLRTGLLKSKRERGRQFFSAWTNRLEQGEGLTVEISVP